MKKPLIPKKRTVRTKTSRKNASKRLILGWTMFKMLEELTGRYGRDLQVHLEEQAKQRFVQCSRDHVSVAYPKAFWTLREAQDHLKDHPVGEHKLSGLNRIRTKHLWFWCNQTNPEVLKYETSRLISVPR